MQTCTVSPEGQIIIPAEFTSALNMKRGDRVSITIEGKGFRVEPGVETVPSAPHIAPDASLEEKRTFYSSPAFIEAASEHFRKARAAVARELAQDH